MNMDFSEALDMSVTRNRQLEELLGLSGRFPRIEHWRDGEIIAVYDMNNGITNVGKNYVLDAAFNAGTQVGAGSWAIGLVDNAGFSALAAADTMSSHGGWTEFVGYSQSTRPAWGQGAAASQSITNASPATFDITSSGTLQGIFITSSGTKSGTAGTLWSTASFTATVPVASSDQMKVSYSLGC